MVRDAGERRVRVGRRSLTQVERGAVVPRVAWAIAAGEIHVHREIGLRRDDWIGGQVLEQEGPNLVGVAVAVDLRHDQNIRVGAVVEEIQAAGRGHGAHQLFKRARGVEHVEVLTAHQRGDVERAGGGRVQRVVPVGVRKRGLARQAIDLGEREGQGHLGRALHGHVPLGDITRHFAGHGGERNLAFHMEYIASGCIGHELPAADRRAFRRVSDRHARLGGAFFRARENDELGSRDILERGRGRDGLARETGRGFHGLQRLVQIRRARAESACRGKMGQIAHRGGCPYDGVGAIVADQGLEACAKDWDTVPILRVAIEPESGLPGLLVVHEADALDRAGCRRTPRRHVFRDEVAR